MLKPHWSGDVFIEAHWGRERKALFWSSFLGRPFCCVSGQYLLAFHFFKLPSLFTNIYLFATNLEKGIMESWNIHVR